MDDPVEELYRRLTDAAAILRARGEISLEISLDDVHRKALLMSAASYFEVRLSQLVQSYCDSHTGADSPISHLVRTKAISRQYHTWFDWESKNVNKFLGLFGAEFKQWCENKIETDFAKAEAIKKFLEIGRDRNRLVHQNFGSFTLEAGSGEIIERYRAARIFVEAFGSLLAEFAPPKHAEE